MPVETFTVRQARPGDLAQLDALFAASYTALLKSGYPPSVMVTAVPLLARAQPRLLRLPTYFVAVDGAGRALGAGGWSPARPQGGPATPSTGSVRHVATDPKALRRGIGRAIMARVFESAREAGLARLDCLSTHTAVPFYEACGFRVLGPVTMALRPGIDFPAVAMVRPI